MAAEAQGLVELGVGELEGSEWIKLAISIQEAKEYTKVRLLFLESSKIG
jgi:hypothetical protein